MNTEENIKGFLEQITGSELALKKIRKTEEEFKRHLFEQIILSVEKLSNRSLLLEKEFDFSLYKYEEPFYEVMDAMFLLAYGEDAANLILFYLYERINPDGSINNLVDEAGTELVLNSPTELYFAVKAISEKKKKPKK